MDSTTLFAVIVAGGFAALICAAVFFYGIAEGLKHKDDKTMPGWAWLCIAGPVSFFLLCVAVIWP